MIRIIAFYLMLLVQFSVIAQEAVANYSELYLTAFSAYEEGDFDEAVKLYSEYLVSSDSQFRSYAFSNRGKSYFELKNYDVAISDLKMSCSLSEDTSLQAHNNNLMGLVYEAKGELGNAYECFLKSHKLDSTNCYSVFNIGRLFELSGDYDLALHAFNESINLNYAFAQDSSALLEVLNRRGDLCRSLEKYSEALIDYLDYLSIDSTSVWMWNRVGLISAENLEDDKGAIWAFDKALELDPEFKDAIFNKGLSLLMLERVEESIELFEEVISLGNSSASYFYALGIAKGEAGCSEDEVCECFDEACKLGVCEFYNDYCLD